MVHWKRECKPLQYSHCKNPMNINSLKRLDMDRLRKVARGNYSDTGSVMVWLCTWGGGGHQRCDTALRPVTQEDTNSDSCRHP